MYRECLNARSPLRLLERDLRGGLGRGNLGIVVAGHGVGKTAFLVGLGLDELLRGGRVLHVCLDDSVAHVRAHYDTVFEELASSTRLEDGVRLRAEVDRRRGIRVYPPGGLTPSKLREAVRLEAETGLQPDLVILDGLDCESIPRRDLVDFRGLARELRAEFWLSATTALEKVSSIPDSIRRFGDLVSVVLALEPGESAVTLRALKGREDPGQAALHVALDPSTLLLIRG